MNNGKPKLEVADFWGAFSDFERADVDQDLGAAGVFIIPERGNLIGGGKDGILYNLNKDNLGKNTWDPQFNLPFVATYLPNPPNGAAGLPTTTPANPNWPIVNLDRNLPAQTPTRKTHHIHGTPVYMGARHHRDRLSVGRERTAQGVQLQLRHKAHHRHSAVRGHSSRRAPWPRPAACPEDGWSSRRTARHQTPVSSGVCIPTQGNANAEVVHGALVAYDATAVTNGKMKQLFHSDDNPANNLGNFAKYATPVVANGRSTSATFSNKVVQSRPVRRRP